MEFLIYDKQEIHEIALNFNENNKVDAYKIINQYAKLINDYIKLIKSNTYDLDNYSIRQFISLFNKSLYNRYNINSYNHIKQLKQCIYDTVCNINYIFQELEDDDIYNECVCVLLKMASLYKDEKPSFDTYVNMCFHYHFKREICKSIADINNDIISINEFEGLGYYIDEHIVYDKVNNDLEKLQILNNTKFKMIDVISVYEDLHLENINWQNGITCSELFKTLNSFERSILIQYYLYNKTNSEIAKEFGLARETIVRKKTIAIDRLEQKCRELNLIK